MAGSVALIAAAVAAIAMVVNWWSRVMDHRGAELLSKPVATLAIGVAGIAGAGDVPTGAIVAAVLGFVLCLMGDVMLLPAVDRFVVGLASFLAGHVAFMVMFAALGLDVWPLAVAAAVVVFGAAGLAGRAIVAAAARDTPRLAMPVRAYLVIISLMVVIGWATGIPAVIIGATLFLVSDSILGWRQFVGERRWMAPAVMMTYHGALVGLALGLQ